MIGTTVLWIIATTSIVVLLYITFELDGFKNDAPQNDELIFNYDEMKDNPVFWMFICLICLVIATEIVRIIKWSLS